MNKINLFKNNAKKRLYIFYKYIAYYLITQNIISIATIPIYSYWGLPFNLLSFIGNIIFIPFLITFIFLSIILFLGFLTKLNFFYISFLLKKLTTLWFFLLINTTKFSSLSIYFIYSRYICLFCWIISFILITFYKLKISIERWLIFSILSFLICILTLKNIPPTKNFFYLKKNNKIISIYNSKNGIYVIDNSNKRKNFNPYDNKWGIFNLISNIAKEYGTISIKKYLLQI